MSTDSFILAKPWRVMPSVSPLQVMRSAKRVMCLRSMDMPWLPMVYWISLMMVCLAASMPKVAATSKVLLDVVPCLNFISENFKSKGSFAYLCINSSGCENFAKIISFDEKLVFGRSRLRIVNVYHSPAHAWQACIKTR